MAPRTSFLLLLPLLAFGMWWVLARGTGSDDVAAPQERGASATGQGPVLKAAPRQTTIGPDGKPLRPGATPVGATSAANVRVHGRVVLPEGFAAGVGVVALLTRDEEPRVLARQALADGLAFDWSVPYGADEPVWALRVSLMVPGLPRRERYCDAEPGEVFPEQFVWSQDELGPLLEGRLTDVQGRPLEGFHIAFALDTAGLVVDAGRSLPVSVDDLLRRDIFQANLLVTTGSGGQFRAPTPTFSTLWPTVLDRRWIVVGHASEGGVRQGDAPVEIRASPALRVRGNVRDALTGKPVADHLRTIGVRAGLGAEHIRKWQVSDATFEWTTAVPTSGTGLVQVKVQVSSRTYEPFETTLYPGPDGLDEVLDVALKPLAPSEIGELLVVSGLCDAQGRRLEVSLAAVQMGMQSGLDKELASERTEPGAEGPVYRMAAGTHQISIRPVGEFGKLMLWSGEVTVAGGRRTPFHVPWPTHGSFRLQYRPRAEGEERLWFSFRNPATDESVSLSPEPSARVTLIPALQVGTWVLTDTTRIPLVEHTVEIVAGAETVFELKR